MIYESEQFDSESSDIFNSYWPDVSDPEGNNIKIQSIQKTQSNCDCIFLKSETRGSTGRVFVVMDRSKVTLKDAGTYLGTVDLTDD